MRHLSSTALFSTLFLFQIDSHQTFLGVTPEKLYCRRGSFIASEAMAGSRPRGQTPSEDERFKQELLHSDKEKREFAFVKQFIHAELAPLCHTMHWEETKVIQTAAMHHLYSRLTGTLKEKVTDRQLLQALHPTPAMGGFPRHHALSHLKEEESFSRGWYASPLGWITPEEADFAIAIRCALIDGKEMRLFSGTGIVEGSHPDKEWEEMNYKISPYLSCTSRSVL
jgi:menaquinone-specific isochorismate synthase